METEIELNNLNLTIYIEYKIWAAEPEVRYTSNGDGYPGSPAEIEILSVCVTSVSGETYDYPEHQLGDWGPDLDRLAMDFVEKDVYENGWIAHHILEDAEAASEEY